MTPAQLDRLPRYAQQEITRLERDLAHFKAKFTRQEAGDTNVWVANYEGDQPLPPGTHIKFKVGGQIPWPSHIEVYEQDGRLVVRHSGDHQKHVAILPVAGNTFEIKLVPR